ncbi:MAG TPA: hypothetical protein VF062_27755 [Candidatus Limnocylindrales bacterium]
MMLYLRSRSVPTSLTVMLSCAVGLWVLGNAVDDPFTRIQLAMLVTLLTTAAISPGLAGADIDIDRIAGFAWPPRRAAHLLIAGALAFGMLSATTLADDPITTIARIARDVTGFIGLTGLGAAFLSARLAPLLSFLWAVPVLAGLPLPIRSTYLMVLTWMLQPTQSTQATITAMAVGVTGVLAYAIRGPRS